MAYYDGVCPAPRHADVNEAAILVPDSINSRTEGRNVRIWPVGE